MRVYFAGPIRGGRNRKDVARYQQLIQYLQKFGEVPTEHVGYKGRAATGENGLPNRHIHDRDMRWLLSAQVIVAEVTKPSLGVGYEIGRAIERGKPVLCLYSPKKGKKLSAMIAGSPDLTLRNYRTLEEAKLAIDEFLSTHYVKK